MKALVIYDSYFGNTEQVAQAIGHQFSAQMDTRTLNVNGVSPEQLSGLDYLIVGSPTRGFKATDAIYALIKAIPSNGLAGVNVAAFDTRLAVEQVNSTILTFLVKIFGYAAEPINARLVKKGGQQNLPPAGFFVEGTAGPMKTGELERAAHWADQIIAA